MMNNNNDNKNIKFTGDPVAFDGVEGKRDPKTGKGRFDLIPEEVYYPLFSKADHDWLLDCHPASILMSIADEKFVEAIIKMTIYSYAEHNEDYAASSSEFWNGVWPMLQDLAIHFQKGAEHYGERNCQKGIPLWSFKDSAMRHASQVFEGKKDEPHAISVIWNCWMAEWTVLHEKTKEKIGPYTVKVLKARTPEEIEAAKSAASTPELKAMKLQSALKEVREAGYLVIQPTADLDTNDLINYVSELLTKKRRELKKRMFTCVPTTPEYRAYNNEQQKLKRVNNAIYTAFVSTSSDTDDKPEITKEHVENNIDEMRQIMADLMKIAEENEVPIITAIQHFYTREEAIEDSLTKRENIKTIIQTIVKKFGAPGVCDIIGALDEFDWCKGGVFSNWFSKFMDTQEGKERAMVWYSPIYLFNELIERVTEQQGQHDYHDFVPLLLQLNSAYTEFLDNNDKS